MLRETICEYFQIADLFGAQVTAVLKISRPEGMSCRQRLRARHPVANPNAVYCSSWVTVWSKIFFR